MQRHFNFKVLFIALIFILTTSCKKSFLEVVPKGKIVATSYDDYDKLMNSSYFYVLRGAYSAGEWQPAALMADDVSAEIYAYNQPNAGYTEARALFQWQDDIFPLVSPANDSSNNPAFLVNMLTNLYTLNKIANEVTSAAGGTDQQKLELQGEALAERAFTNFILISYFTKPYNAATASTDPGFPVITTADITNNNFLRGTVQQSYDAVINDLVKAIASLSVQPVIRTRISKPAAETLLGKVYLFMGRFSDALIQLKNATDDLQRMSSPPVLYDYNQTMSPNGSFQPYSSVTGPNSPFTNTSDITESIWAVSTYGGTYNENGFPSNFLTISNSTAALFDPSDLRLQFYTKLQEDQATPIPGGRMRRNNLVWARVGVELPDLYLLRAEAEARAGNLQTAKTYVELLRKGRMPVLAATVPVSTAASQSALIRFIIDERGREFAQTGARWFDMRRLANDPLYSGMPAAQHILYQDATNGTTFTLKPARFTLRIPPLYLSQNPGMIDNP